MSPKPIRYYPLRVDDQRLSAMVITLRDCDRVVYDTTQTTKRYGIRIAGKELWMPTRTARALAKALLKALKSENRS